MQLSVESCYLTPTVIYVCRLFVKRENMNIQNFKCYRRISKMCDAYNAIEKQCQNVQSQEVKLVYVLKKYQKEVIKQLFSNFFFFSIYKSQVKGSQSIDFYDWWREKKLILSNMESTLFSWVDSLRHLTSQMIPSKSANILS